MDWNEDILWGNSLRNYLIAVSIVVVAVLIFQILKGFAKRWIARFSKRSGDSRVGSLILKTIRYGILPFLYLIALYVAINTLSLSAFIQKAMKVAMAVVTVFFVVRIITMAIESFLEHHLQKEGKEETKNAMRGVVLIVQVILWVLGLVYLLGNLGYNVGTVLAGMGIGGIAIALAAQNILGDVFAYFSILFEKPFEVGDYLGVGSKSGTVTRIGIRSTRIKDDYGEEMLYSNRNLLNEWIQNYSRMESRYAQMGFNVSYSTPVEKLEKLKQEVEKIVLSQDKVKLDWVFLKEFKDFGIYFEVRFFSMEKGFKEYMQKRHNVYLGISRLLTENDIRFAFTTSQEVWMKKEEGKI